MSIFVGQGYLTLVLETGVDLTAASSILIKYKSPSGTRGTFSGTLSGTSKIVHDFTNTELNIAGVWHFQSYAVIGGLNAYGEIVRHTISSVI